MTEIITSRLLELRTELETGQRMMDEMNARQAVLRASMLRISGAIQVLEELLRNETAPPLNSAVLKAALAP